MCGECTQMAGLHVPEDLVHLDVYDPRLQSFVEDGSCGRGVLTTLLPPGGKTGMLLINYDTEDTTVVLSREKCGCGRTHMRIHNPEREAETVWIFANSMNRVDVEAAVFQHENMDYLTGEFEASIHEGETPGEVTLNVNVECINPEQCNRRLIENHFVERFLRHKPGLARHFHDGDFHITVKVVPPGGLELHTAKGRPKRLVDHRGHGS